MKKDIKKKKIAKKASKPRKIEVIVDMTELPASEAIRKSQIEMGIVNEAVHEVEKEILIGAATDMTKSVKWYQKLWEAIKSLF